MRMSKSQYFTTSDLNLSAVLVANGFPLEHLDKSVKGRSTFYFTKTDQLDELIDSYWRTDLCIEPQSLFNSLKAIKNRMYSR